VASHPVVTAKTDSSHHRVPEKSLRRSVTRSVAPPELAKAKAYLTLGLPGDFETTGVRRGEFRELFMPRPASI